MRSLIGSLLLGSLLNVTSAADDGGFSHLRDHTQRLLRSLEAGHCPLPIETAAPLRKAIETGEKDPEAASATIQKLLDPLCLIVVSINPESRVKAARGPSSATMTVGRAKCFLIKVQNDAGVTHGLEVGSAQFARGASKVEGWLHATLLHDVPTRKALTGQKVEYVILRLIATEAGRREATLKFDVGQGTQDLGFRAEVPVLFTVNGSKDR
jgi:hypothetical protein